MESEFRDSATQELVEKMRQTKAPRTLTKILREATLPALLFEETGEQVDEDFMKGLLRHIGSGSREISREVVQGALDRKSAGDLALALLALWEANGYNGRYDWIAAGAALLGDDRTALELERCIQQWQRNSSSSWRKKAAALLYLFDRMDTPTSLMVLVGLTHSQDIPTVYDAAVRALQRAADRRKMSWHELSDSVIPDCGLDARGTRIFELGEAVRLRLVLDREFEPVLRDEKTRKVYDSPESYPDDERVDAQKRRDAIYDWGLMLARLRELITIQTRRMEEVMVHGRLWSAERFEELILKHPLMVNFAKSLVWGIYDANHHLLGTFRASEEGDLMDVEDAEVKLEATHFIGLVHPVDLSVSQCQKWAESLADYEIFAPFDQLGRQVYLPDESLLSSREEADPTPGQLYTSKALRAVMKREAWRRDTDGGYRRMFFYKPFETHELSAYVHLDPGLQAGGERWDDDQHIVSIKFKPFKRGAHHELLREVPLVCYSEARRFLELVKSEQESHGA